MPFDSLTPAEWQDFVAGRAAQLADRPPAEALMRFELLPRGPYADQTGATVYRGDLTIDGNFTPPSQVIVIDGDVNVSGTLSTVDRDNGGDGQITLVIFGDVRCGSIDHDWGSILFVTGDMIVADWVFTAREDSAFVVGGDLRTPIFIGGDIWAAVGGAVEMEYGYGYAVGLKWCADAYGAPQILPAHGWRELALKLGIGRSAASDTAQFLDVIEARLRETGTLNG
ncbi:hypothetical protein [Sphingomonas sp.]|uniref:hypothetical protein n=1 Tax=Sphingomonas sp. TaxID=28214 RepID=UPI003B3A242B